MKVVVSVVTINIFKSLLHRFVDRLIPSSALRISNFVIMPLSKTVNPLLTTPVYLSPIQVNMSMCISNVSDRFCFLNYIVGRIFFFPSRNLL